MTVENCTLAIKIDIDTLKGYQEGLPRLLDILKARDVRASIFFSMGPDESGKALRRIFRKGFLSKMLRTKAPSTYGLKTLCYGTLLPAPMIVASAPDLMRRALDEGHDCGIHAWNHVLWQDRLPRMTKDVIREELTRAMELFEEITGTCPTSCAAPGWQVTPDSLAVQDELKLAYCSDTRGFMPFIPRFGGHVFRTPQVPSTLPTLDEVLGRDGLNAQNVKDYYLDLLEPGLNVLTIHTEMEGGVMSGVFDSFMDACRMGDMDFMTLREALAASLPLPEGDIEMLPIPGRAGTVAVQVDGAARAQGIGH